MALWAWRCCLLLAILLLVGLIPVNYAFEPSGEGIEILVTSTAVHADFILPLVTNEKDWRQDFAGQTNGDPTATYTHVAIGWGDRGFFLETPTWADLRVATAANALLWPSSTCLHVQLTKANYYSQATSIRISPQQYRRLVQFIESSFRRSATGEMVVIPGYRYHTDDAFYEAVGQYHMLNTCNSWIGRGLAAAGVRTPWLSPIPHSPTIYLK